MRTGCAIHCNTFAFNCQVLELLVSQLITSCCLDLASVTDLSPTFNSIQSISLLSLFDVIKFRFSL